jgi:hypothetical protein
MDRKREEPTLGKPDIGDMEFRPRSYRGPSQRASDESSLWLKGGMAAVVAIVVVMGLIEWSARRSAAAMMAELNRPATPEERARFNAEMQRLTEESERDVRNAVRTIQLTPQVEYAPPAPLRPGERCIRGRRFERLENGWRDRPNEPC